MVWCFSSAIKQVRLPSDQVAVQSVAKLRGNEECMSCLKIPVLRCDLDFDFGRRVLNKAKGEIPRLDVIADYPEHLVIYRLW